MFVFLLLVTRKIRDGGSGDVTPPRVSIQCGSRRGAELHVFLLTSLVTLSRSLTLSGPGFLYKPGLGPGRLSAAGVDDCEALRTQEVLIGLKGRRTLMSGQHRRCWWGRTEIQPSCGPELWPSSQTTPSWYWAS